MDKDLERLVVRGRLLDRVLQQSLRINELETQLLNQRFKKAAKKQRRKRRLQLRWLAECDQINADVRQQIKVQEENQ